MEEGKDEGRNATTSATAVTVLSFYATAGTVKGERESRKGTRRAQETKYTRGKRRRERQCLSLSPCDTCERQKECIQLVHLVDRNN